MLWLQLLLTLSWVITLISANAPVFTVQPVSIDTIEGSEVEFTCTANNSFSILYFVDDAPVTDAPVIDKGFMQISETLPGGLRIANLTVTASSSLNNTMILCRADGSPSDEVILRVQGPLSSVVDLSYSFIDSSTVNISWSPPFTLPGTDITGYNISATSNGTTTNYFTSNSYYELSLTDITDSPCNEIIITVSGYNGLDGEQKAISIDEQSIQTIPISLISLVQEVGVFTIKLQLNVSSICYGQYPTHIDLLTIQYSNNGSQLTTIDNIPLVSTDDSDILTIEITVQLPIDSDFTAIATFNNFAAIQSSITFRTRTLIAKFTDTVGPSVEFMCHFYADSDAIGCRIELYILTDGIIQYNNGTGNRIDGSNEVNGTINGVNTEGVYNVSVYEIEKDDLVFPVILDTVAISLPNSTVASSATTTTLSSTSTMTFPTTSTVPPSTTPTHERDNATIIIAVLAGIIVVVLAVTVWCSYVVLSIAAEEKSKNTDDKSDMDQPNKRNSISLPTSKSSTVLPEKDLVTTQSDKSSTDVSESSPQSCVSPVHESMETTTDGRNSIPIFRKSNTESKQQLSKNVLTAHDDSDYLELGLSEQSSNKNDREVVVSGVVTDQDKTTTTTTTFCDENSTLLPLVQKHSVKACEQENAQDQQSKVCTYADLDSVREQPPPRPRQTEKEVIYWDVQPTLSSSPPLIPSKKKNTQIMLLQTDESSKL